MKTHTIALVFPKTSTKGSASSPAFEILQDEYEIEYLENALRQGDKQPLQEILYRRTLINEKEDLQADYVEELLSRPFARPNLQKQAVLWLKSKMKLNTHRQNENQAALVIAEYAYQIYQSNPDRIDFLLAGPNSQVRIRIFPLVTRLQGT